MAISVITLKRVFVGQRIYFPKGSQFYISNYALDLSGMTAVVTGIGFHDNRAEDFIIRVRLDSPKYLKDLAEWDNTLEFYGSNLDDSTIWELVEQAREIPHDYNIPREGGCAEWFIHTLKPYDPVKQFAAIYTLVPF